MLLRRSHDISRLEAFSDAVFAFALTLLVVALEVPKSYDELMKLMGGFLSFACCFSVLLLIWYEHNIFFRRYGLSDPYTVVLNGGLLFVVMFTFTRSSSCSTPGSRSSASFRTRTLSR
jgi:uncharacterized membrane protein